MGRNIIIWIKILYKTWIGSLETKKRGKSGNYGATTIEIFRFALFFLCLKVNNGLPKCIVHYIKDAVDKEMM